MKLYRLIVVVVTIVCMFTWSLPAQAITLSEEEKLGNEFLRYLRRHYQLVEDPMILGHVNNVGRKILSVMPAQPFTYRFYVVKESVYNAFAIPAGHVFINSGLLAAMESEDELAGILGHEIAHVACRHISNRIERSKKINLATMAGVVAGIFLGAATGNPDAISTLAIGSVAAGQTASLSFSRQDEVQADDMGIEYLVKADYDPRGLVSVLNKIRGKQWFGSDQIPTYMMTHPAVEDRLAWIDNWITAHPQAITSSQSLAQDAMLKKIKIRLTALYDDPDSAVEHFRAAVAKAPDDADLAYGYGMALDRAGNRTHAVQQLKKALSHNAFDPFILGDLGRIYYAQGKFEASRSTLQGALSLKAPNPQARFYLGRTYLSQGELQAAADTFEQLVGKHENYHEAYYFLGETYTKLKREPEAQYNLGLFHFKRGGYSAARFHLSRAQGRIRDPAKEKIIDKHLKTINQRLKEIKEASG